MIPAPDKFCYDCTEIHEYWKTYLPRQDSPDNCVDDDETFSPAMLSSSNWGRPCPFPGRARTSHAVVQPTTPYCFNPSNGSPPAALRQHRQWLQQQLDPRARGRGGSTAEREFFAQVATRSTRWGRCASAAGSPGSWGDLIRRHASWWATKR